ncbi:DUF4333 domain-containing protein [Nocardia camponoti]|uniref:DUF4333 domain-containing protein n=1 Tax=Nocardia camponoti TaxID=1616106 RepID=A0A917V5W9_9NOCA|nr:DUF4333 domain-containing protein [Nocardia camponoti]GGK41324.1 hypothetical protein GCM10011591_11000 [Nocardia camponoti]
MKTTVVVGFSALAITFAVAGCSFEIGGAKVNEADLERSVSETLSTKIGTPVSEVDCPGDLSGKVGTTMRCTITVDGEQLGTNVTVTAVDGDIVNYDIAVDPS